MPDYEPPSFSLNAAAQRAIADLLRAPNLRKLESHLDEAVSAVTTAASDINDRLSNQRQDAARKPRRNNEAEDDTEMGDGGDEALQSLDELQDKVTRMTQRMEERMRKGGRLARGWCLVDSALAVRRALRLHGSPPFIYSRKTRQKSPV